MADPSPRSHLYRLATLLAAGFVGFLVIKAVATPSSWNFEEWYRSDAVVEIAQQPLVYGGNESCKSCHKEEQKEFRKRKHRRLSCESCHGALADHVKGDEKSANAVVDTSSWQCENCHLWRINRPTDFPQFTLEVEKHKTIEEGEVCLKCHEDHEHTP